MIVILILYKISISNHMLWNNCMSKQTCSMSMSAVRVQFEFLKSIGMNDLGYIKKSVNGLLLWSMVVGFAVLFLLLN